jgi:S-formylglutathione hydrolase FrmB
MKKFFSLILWFDIPPVFYARFFTNRGKSYRTGNDQQRYSGTQCLVIQLTCLRIMIFHSVLTPVVYLLHGFTDDNTGWLQFGEINRYADKAIADGTIPPMIIIMPNADSSW